VFVTTRWCAHVSHNPDGGFAGRSSIGGGFDPDSIARA